MFWANYHYFFPLVTDYYSDITAVANDDDDDS